MDKGRIIVKELCKFAISETNGLKLRKEIEMNLQEHESVELDFTGITMFTTPFFNSSIGFFILQWGPEVFEQKIHIIKTSLTEIGQLTLDHSVDNAELFYKNKLSMDSIGKLVEKNVTED